MIKTLAKKKEESSGGQSRFFDKQIDLANYLIDKNEIKGHILNTLTFGDKAYLVMLKSECDDEGEKCAHIVLVDGISGEQINSFKLADVDANDCMMNFNQI